MPISLHDPCEHDGLEKGTMGVSLSWVMPLTSISRWSSIEIARPSLL